MLRSGSGRECGGAQVPQNRESPRRKTIAGFSLESERVRVEGLAANAPASSSSERHVHAKERSRIRIDRAVCELSRPVVAALQILTVVEIRLADGSDVLRANNFAYARCRQQRHGVRRNAALIGERTARDG